VVTVDKAVEGTKDNRLILLDRQKK
jgi:hypothetical protein